MKKILTIALVTVVIVVLVMLLSKFIPMAQSNPDKVTITGTVTKVTWQIDYDGINYLTLDGNREVFFGGLSYLIDFGLPDVSGYLPETRPTVEAAIGKKVEVHGEVHVDESSGQPVDTYYVVEPGDYIKLLK